MHGYFRIKWNFDVELDLNCDWYFSNGLCTHVVTGDSQVEDPFPTFSML